MTEDIGYMQVQLKLFRNDQLYVEFAFNAYDGKYQTVTDLIKSEFEIIDDPAGQVDKLVTLLIKVAEDNYTIAMLIPVHQSDVWEVSEISDVYRVEFYCIEGSS